MTPGNCYGKSQKLKWLSKLRTASFVTWRISTGDIVFVINTRHLTPAAQLAESPELWKKIVDFFCQKLPNNFLSLEMLCETCWAICYMIFGANQDETVSTKLQWILGGKTAIANIPLCLQNWKIDNTPKESSQTQDLKTTIQKLFFNFYSFVILI